MGQSLFSVRKVKILLYAFDDDSMCRLSIYHYKIGVISVELHIASSLEFQVEEAVNALNIDFYGFSIHADTKTVSIEKCMDFRLPVFFTRKDDVLVVGNHIHQVRMHKGDIEWDTAYFSYYLLQEEAQTRETPFKGVGKVLNGERISIDWQAGHVVSCMEKARAVLFPEASEVDPAHALRSSLLQGMKEHDCLLEFSGGVDSTALLLCALSSKKKVRALTAWDSSSSAPDDYLCARALSSKYELDHAFVDFSSLAGMSLDFPVHSHHPSQMFMGFCYERRLLDLCHDMRTAVYVNGHGGDHLFMANPPMECAVTLLLQGRIAQGLSVLRTLSEFYCIPYVLALRRLLETMARYLYQRDCMRPYWATVHEYSIKDWICPDVFRHVNEVNDYRKIIKYALLGPESQLRVSLFYQLAQEISHFRLRDIFSRLKFPFFNVDVIRAASALPIVQSFDRSHSRKAFRTAFYTHYREEALWRKSKGHTTAMALRALTRQYDAVCELLRHGFLVESGMAYWSGLECELKKIRYGIGGISPGFMHALAVELFVRQTRERYV